MLANVDAHYGIVYVLCENKLCLQVFNCMLLHKIYLDALFAN
jgi:hypothetical protein